MVGKGDIILVHEDEYTSTAHRLRTELTFPKFGMLGHHLAWLALLSSYLLATVNILAQVNKKTYSAANRK